MTTIYKVKGTYGSTPIIYSCNESDLEAIKANPLYTLESVEAYTPVIRYRTAAGCERCTHDEYVPHYNCLYQGRAMGHSEAHCTANGCY